MSSENECVYLDVDSMDPTDLIECSYDPIEVEYMHHSPNSSVAGKKSRPKQKSYRKKVETVWQHENIIQLIKEVEVRQSLWDVGCAQYKLPKDILWQEVADSMYVSINDCKGKWANLRTTFNCNLEKLRRKKSGQGADEQFEIVWRYFKPMLFLEKTKVRQTTHSISSIELKSATTDESMLGELGLNDDLGSTSFLPVQKRSRKSDASTTTSSKVHLKEMALEALQSLKTTDSQSKDASTLLGEYIAAELKNLPPEQATFARAKLRRSFNEIMDEVALMVPLRQNN